GQKGAFVSGLFFGMPLIFLLVLTFERQLSLAEGERISRTSQQDVGERACRDRDVPSQPVRPESR
ncbi:hypothetical protein ACFL9S_12170, partial [Erwinia sp. AnSW2-5]|uniref:hypothetical protein n=1 Tax=Erwinia sp. AnSW2-5 TaxID=3367692 RepID=UPI003859C5AD